MSVRMVTKGRPGKTRKSSRQRAVEMRDEGDHHVRLRFLPMRFQQAHRRPMIQANHSLQHPHELRAAQCPAGAEHPVVGVLNPNPGVFLQDVELVEQFLKIGEFHFPGRCCA